MSLILYITLYYNSSYFVDFRTREATTIAPTAAMLPTIASPITPSDKQLLLFVAARSNYRCSAHTSWNLFINQLVEFNGLRILGLMYQKLLVELFGFNKIRHLIVTKSEVIQTLPSPLRCLLVYLCNRRMNKSTYSCFLTKQDNRSPYITCE
jgi:hypothetical protein